MSFKPQSRGVCASIVNSMLVQSVIAPNRIISDKLFGPRRNH